MRRILPLLTFSALLAPLAAAPAAAQGMIRPNQQQTAPQGPPPALPGLATRRPVQPIPPEPGQNLSPNAALFDAIARGDLPAAREAVARGANLEARNALGLTPLDAAVDQGRNEIVFYLLSARDAVRGPVAGAPTPSRGEASLNTPPPSPAPQRSPARREAATASAPAAPSPARAQLWAGDGGTPRPELGFLGFDAGRPTATRPGG